MSYIVNRLDFNISYLTQNEVYDMTDLVNLVMRDGKVDWYHPAWIAWFKESGFDENQGLLVYSTAFVQRLSLAIIEWFKEDNLKMQNQIKELSEFMEMRKYNDTDSV